VGTNGTQHLAKERRNRSKGMKNHGFHVSVRTGCVEHNDEDKEYGLKDAPDALLLRLANGQSYRNEAATSNGWRIFPNQRRIPTLKSSLIREIGYADLLPKRRNLL
jgi:hypothetical protein